MPKSTTARRFYEGLRQGPLAWPEFEGIFDILCGPDSHRLPSWPETPRTFWATWEDANRVEHTAESLKEIEEAYRAEAPAVVTFGFRGHDGKNVYFEYHPELGLARVRVAGPPVDVDAMIKPVEEAFPLQRRVVFISWSGERAKEVAEGLRDILLSKMPRGGEVFLSTWLAPGTPPLEGILDNLLATDAHLAVITADSAKSAWVTWETSASWARGKPVVPVFVGVRPEEVPGPLTLVAQGVPIETIGEAVATVLSAVGGTVEIEELVDELESVQPDG